MEKKQGHLTAAIVEKLPLLVVIFCVIQPVLDVMGYWQVKLGIPNTVTLLLRMGLLCGSVLLGFILSRRRWIYWVMAGVLGLFTIGHIISCLQAGYLNPVDDLMNQIRIFLLPLTALCFITFLQSNEKVYPALKRGLVIALAIIVLVQILSTVTGTDPHTYSAKGYGVLGWFMWTNTQSAVLCILAPIAIAWSLNRWQSKVIPVLCVTLVSLGSLYFLAPRLSYAGLVAAGVGMAVSLVIADRKRMKQAVAILLCAVLFVALYPVSATYKNQTVISQDDAGKQSEVNRILESSKLNGIHQGESEEEEELSEEEQGELLSVMEEIYAPYLKGVINKFGIERVAEAYNYSVNIDEIGGNRLKKVTFCKLLLEDSPKSAWLFGMELDRMQSEIDVYDWSAGKWTKGMENFDVENDLHGIFFLCGGVGLVLMILFLAYFGVRAVWALIRDFKSYFTIDFAALAIGYCCALVHIYCTASLLRRNNGSVYLALLLAMAGYLTQKKFSKKAVLKAAEKGEAA